MILYFRAEVHIYVKKPGNFMQILFKHLSDIIIPVIIFYIVAEGLLARKDIYEDFVKGAKEGIWTVVKIMPTLIGLMMAVGILRASGFLDFVEKTLGGAFEGVGFPSRLIPLAVIKLFSSSAATGLVLDIFKEFGTDSYIGLLTSIMMSCTETVFYTMSVYFMAAKVTKTKFTVAGALFCTFAGILASVIITMYLCR